MNQQTLKQYEQRLREQQKIIIEQRRRIEKLVAEKPGGDDFKKLEERIREQRQIILEQRRSTERLEAENKKQRRAFLKQASFTIAELERALQIAANEYVHDVFELGEDEDITADIEKVIKGWLEQAGCGDGR